MKQAEVYVNEVRCGIPASVAEKMIERMRGCLPEWEELIDRSFLPEGMKAAYRELLRRRDEELIR